MLAPLRQNPRKGRRAQAVTRPAPVGGWNARDSVDDMPATDALLMDNWFPGTDSIKLRPGSGINASRVGQIETFSRASTATYFDEDGVLQTAAIDIPRYKESYYISTGIQYYTTPQLMVESASTNYCLYNRDLTNAAWTKTNVTAAKTSTGLDGVANSCTRITATSNNGTVLQAVTAPTGCRMAYFAKRIAGTGKLLPSKDGTNFSVLGANPAIGEWIYIGFSTAAINPTIGFRLQTSGDAWDIDMVMLESGSYTSPIPTTSASVTRAADTITYGGTSDATTTVATIESLMPYSSGSTNKLLAAANGCIYNITNGGITSAPLDNGFTSDRWQEVNFNGYLLAFNGADTPQKYDGSTLADTSITGVTSSNLIYPWVFKNRVFMVEKNTLSAWYLDTLAIAGAATELDFSGIFTMGGKLVFGATWSRDGGSGADDFCVFGTDKGEVAVYQGTDPDSAVTWDLVGVYRIGAPIGQRPVFKISADLVIITVDGFVPLSKVLAVDRVGAEGLALSDKIRDAVNIATRSHGSKFGWQAIHYPKAAWGLFNVPIVEGTEQHQYVVNTITGAWCRFKNMNASCWAVFQDNLYFGTTGGLVYQADSDIGDEDSDGNRQVTTADVRPAFDYMGSKGQQKQFTVYRPLITSDGSPNISAVFDVDFAEGTPASISANDVAGSEWDVAEWDVSAWSSSNIITNNWYSASGVGYCASLHLRAVTNALNISLNSINYQFTPAGLM